MLSKTAIRLPLFGDPHMTMQHSGNKRLSYVNDSGNVLTCVASSKPITTPSIFIHRSPSVHLLSRSYRPVLGNPAGLIDVKATSRRFMGVSLFQSPFFGWL